MRFLIDENISPDATEIFIAHGLNACHINELKANQKQRVADDQLRRLSIQKGFIIVSKDDDFVHSFVDRKVPEKLVFLFALDHKPQLMNRLNEVVPLLHELVQKHDFIEVNKKEIKFPFSN